MLDLRRRSSDTMSSSARDRGLSINTDVSDLTTHQGSRAGTSTGSIGGERAVCQSSMGSITDAYSDFGGDARGCDRRLSGFDVAGTASMDRRLAEPTAPGDDVFGDPHPQGRRRSGLSGSMDRGPQESMPGRLVKKKSAGSASPSTRALIEWETTLGSRDAIGGASETRGVSRPCHVAMAAVRPFLA